MQKTTSSKQSSFFLSIGQASEYLGVSIDTLRRWEKKGKLKTLRSPGGHRYFRKEDLEKVFGTRYEREETKKQDISEISSINLENLEIEKKEKISPQTIKTQETKTKDYYSDKLNVPRFIKADFPSKFERLLKIEKPEPILSTENLTPTSFVANSSSILQPPQISTETIYKDLSSIKLREKSSIKNIAIIAITVTLIFGAIFLIVLSLQKPEFISPLP